MRKLTQEQKIKAENAELIAKFEGYEVITENEHRVIIYYVDNERAAIDTYYEYSWDWLMPVVGKCLSLDFMTTGNELYNKLHEAVWDLNREEVYKTVVEIIQKNNERQ